MRYLISAVVLLATWVSRAEAAEIRTWTAAAGGFTIEAELVELRPFDIVRLKTKDGRTIDVPLAQLSATDQAVVRPGKTVDPVPVAVSTVMPAKPSLQLTRALKAADRCRNPDEAIIVLKVFCDDPQNSAEERAYAAGRIADCKDAAAKSRVRVNQKWVAKEEADAVRKKADELMRQGLQLLKLKQEDAFKRKFTEAAALEPEEIRAEFLMALIYTFGRRADKAMPIFQKCLARDPENIAVLNNVAMLAAAKREYATALSAWRRALDFHPDQRVVHNIGRFLEQANESGVAIPKTVIDGLSLPYAELTASGKFDATTSKVGWLLMLIEESDLDIELDDDDKKEQQKSPAPEPNDDGAVIGSGTGFVIQPGFVLTNAHVAMDDAAYEVQAPDGTRHKATRVAADKDLDLALLKCEPLTAPALVLHDSIVPRGTDVMLFGYPEMLVLGASLKATRGSISSLPDPQINSKYLYDAVSNAGNSGGPLCDAGANVVAVHSTGYNTASRYAGGIPSTQAIEFVKKALPEFKQLAPSAAKLEWPKVDERAAASTMLIWIRKKNARAETASAAGAGGVIELPFCLFCGGLGKMKCDRVGCVGGYLITRQGKLTCPSCEGKFVYDCGVCDGVGIDAKLASVQRAVASLAAKANTTTEPPTSPATSSMTRPPPNTSAGTTPRPNPSTGSLPSRPGAPSRSRVNSTPGGPIVGPHLPDNPVPALATGTAVDLLAKVNPEQQYSPGKWTRQGSAIVGGIAHWSRLSVPYIPPPEYDVSVEIQCLRGTPCFQMGLVSSAGRQFNIGIEPHQLGTSVSRTSWTLDPVSGVDLQSVTKIRYIVRRQEVAVLINNVKYFHRRIDPAQISVTSGNDYVGEDLKRMFFGSQHSGCEFRITEMTLIPVTR